MKVRLAKRTGFCFGVRRAVGLADEALKNTGNVWSLGSIIHNRAVVDELSTKGLMVIKDIDEASEGTVVVSSHGISPDVARRIRDKKLRLVDTTCPFVMNAQRIASSLSGAGYKIIIVGEATHPEVKALIDFVTPGMAFVVKDAKEAEQLGVRRSDRCSLISQTTQSTGRFLDVAMALLRKRPKELRIVDTICKDVEERQDEARELARRVDVIIVVGGRNSANTRRLLEVCSNILKDSYLVESEDDLRGEWFNGRSSVGIVSGASTPDRMVRKVVDAILAKSRDVKAGKGPEKGRRIKTNRFKIHKKGVV